MYKAVAMLVNKSTQKPYGYLLQDIESNMTRKESMLGTKVWVSAGQVTNLDFSSNKKFLVGKGGLVLRKLERVEIEVAKRPKSRKRYKKRKVKKNENI